MDPADRFRLLAGVALADGRLDPAERDVLSRSAQRLGLPPQVSAGILDDLQAGGKVRNLAPPADPAERTALFQDLLRVVLADQVVSAEEERCLKRLAQGFGVAPAQLTALMQGLQAPAAVSPPPPPVPAKTAVTGKLKAPTKHQDGSCPSCGATVEWRNARSVAKVCEYCDSTVVREGSEKALQDLGHVSHVVPDASPIRIGARGRCFGVEFEVLGRLQVQHERGFWNEWYLEWNDRRTGWLGEALGEYLITFPDASEGSPGEQLPRFQDLRPGLKVFLSKKRWTVTDVRVARATGTEGETPFALGEGYELPYADLRRSDDGFATIDYSEEKPLVFAGRCVSWSDLNLRDYRTFDGW